MPRLGGDTSPDRSATQPAIEVTHRSKEPASEDSSPKKLRFSDVEAPEQGRVILGTLPRAGQACRNCHEQRRSRTEPRVPGT